MPWVSFIADFDWSPPKYGVRIVIAYKAGMAACVHSACAEAAIASGKAVSIERPSDGKEPQR